MSSSLPYKCTNLLKKKNNKKKTETYLCMDFAYMVRAFCCVTDHRFAKALRYPALLLLFVCSFRLSFSKARSH